jgi:hypothetical protein
MTQIVSTLSEPTTHQTPRATLLGLPTELRLQIFELLIHEELEYNPIECFREQGFAPVRNTEAHLRLSWVQLLRSCKTTAEEVQDLLKAPDRRPRSACDAGETTSQHETNTWLLTEALPLGLGYVPARDVTWRSISCSPSDVKHLVLELHFGLAE